MYLCMCKGISVSEVVETARKSLMPLDTLVESLGLGEDDSCGRCAIYKHEIARIIAIELKKPQGNSTPQIKSINDHGGMTTGNPPSQVSPPKGANRWPWSNRRNYAA